VVVWLALVQELLDAETVARQPARELGFERGAFGEPIHLADEEVAHPFLVGDAVLGGLQLLVGLAPPGQRRVALLLEVGFEHLPRRRLAFLTSEDGQVFFRRPQ
jgi:hypothetical protein